MDERGFSILRQLMSDVEGAPSPGVIKDELYSIWYEHAQSVAQEALEYLNTMDPGHGPEADEPLEFERYGK
jgi:hypothetical protein